MYTVVSFSAAVGGQASTGGVRWLVGIGGKTRTVHWETYLRKKHFSFSFPWYLAIDGKIILHDNLTHQIQKYIAYINEQ